MRGCEFFNLKMGKTFGRTCQSRYPDKTISPGPTVTPIWTRLTGAAGEQLQAMGRCRSQVTDANFRQERDHVHLLLAGKRTWLRQAFAAADSAANCSGRGVSSLSARM